MVLQGGPCGRVDRRRTSFTKSANVLNYQTAGALFLCTRDIRPHESVSTTSSTATAQYCLLSTTRSEADEMAVTKRMRTSEDALLRNPRNEVFLEGRVSSPPLEKLLPSGDRMVEFRIVIDRADRRGTKREVDTLDIAVWLSRPRKSALSLRVDDWVSIDGAVRRRFWRAPTGLASRWQVEASQVRRL